MMMMMMWLRGADIKGVTPFHLEFGTDEERMNPGHWFDVSALSFLQ